MDYINLYKEELSIIAAKYFILDTKGPGAHGDADFIEYQWDLDKYQKVREGDLFIYRRPGSASEISGQFYFFGAGWIGKIEKINQIG